METLPGLPRLGHASTVSVCFSPAVENFLYLKSRQASFDVGGEINFVKKNSAFSFLNSSTSWYVLPFLCFCSQDFPLFLIIHLSSPLSNVQSKRLFLTGENLAMFFEVVVTAVTVVIVSAFLVVFLVVVLLVGGLRVVVGFLLVVVLLVTIGFLVVVRITFLLGAVAGFFVTFVVFMGFDFLVGFSTVIVVFLVGEDSLLDSQSPGKDVEHCSPASQAEHAGPFLYIWPLMKLPLGP